MANLPTIKLVKEKTAVYYDGRKKIDCPDMLYKVGKQILNDYIEEDREALAVILLDTKNKPIGNYVVSTGTLNQSLVHPREVFKKAIVSSANKIMLLHNHPSGDANPSREDLMVTKRLAEVGEIVGIEVLDHLVIGSDDFYSFREKGNL